MDNVDKVFPDYGSKAFWTGEFHREFVDKIHETFDIPRPRYSTIVFVPDLLGARAIMRKGEKAGVIKVGYNKYFKENPLLEFNDYPEYVSLLQTIYHESAHILHNCVKDFPPVAEGGLMGISHGNYYLKETIADLATLQMARSKPEYILEDIMKSEDTDKLALDLFRLDITSEKLLRELICLEMKDARPIMLELLNRNYLYTGHRERFCLKDMY